MSEVEDNNQQQQKDDWVFGNLVCDTVMQELGIIGDANTLEGLLENPFTNWTERALGLWDFIAENNDLDITQAALMLNFDIREEEDKNIVRGLRNFLDNLREQ